MMFQAIKSRQQFFLVSLLAVALVCWPGGHALAQERQSQFGGSTMAEREANRRDVSTMLEAATVWVMAEGPRGQLSTGSGFVVAPGHVVTNAHVIWQVPKNGSVWIVNDTLPVTEARLVD
ncbi:MAG: hypothetical protein LBU69_05715, partial [Deltaproteobacteria bacterium]|nr:hypothetical protein [Deltaproteobacteria bacterium]